MRKRDSHVDFASLEAESTERQSVCKWPFARVANRAPSGGQVAKSGAGQEGWFWSAPILRGSERELPPPHGRFGAIKGSPDGPGTAW
jgi:hypothetical protein